MSGSNRNLFAADAGLRWTAGKLLFCLRNKMLLVRQAGCGGECAAYLISSLLTFRPTLHILPADPEHLGGFVRYPVTVIYAESEQGKY